jgi:hypothetical protein
MLPRLVCDGRWRRKGLRLLPRPDVDEVH